MQKNKPEINHTKYEIRAPLQTLKLYMPLTADLYAADEYGDVEDERELLDGRELRQYEAEITAVLKRERIPREEERGVMRWYDKADAVDDKVRSVVFALENRGGRLWGVAECKVWMMAPGCRRRTRTSPIPAVITA